MKALNQTPFTSNGLPISAVSRVKLLGKLLKNRSAVKIDKLFPADLQYKLL